VISALGEIAAKKCERCGRAGLPRPTRPRSVTSSACTPEDGRPPPTFRLNEERDRATSGSPLPLLGGEVIVSFALVPTGHSASEAFIGRLCWRTRSRTVRRTLFFPLCP